MKADAAIPEESGTTGTKDSGTKESGTKESGTKESGAKAPTVKIRVQDSGGRTIREIDAPGRKGISRVAWDLRDPLSVESTAGSDGWFGAPKGPFVVPGEYTVTLVAGGREQSQKFEVRVDPRTRTSPDALRARQTASAALNDMLRAFDEAAKALQGVDREIEVLEKLAAAPGDQQAPVRDALAALIKKVQPLRDRFRGTGFGGPRFEITDLAGQLQAFTGPPTEAQARSVERLRTTLTEHIANLNTVISTDLPAIHALTRAGGATPSLVKPVRPPG